METFSTINPYTGITLKTYGYLNLQAVEAKIQEAQESFLVWKDQSLEERSAVLKCMAGLLRKNKELFSQLMASEIGKPLRQGLEEVEKCAVTCEYFAEQGPSILKMQKAEGPYQVNEIHVQPQGVILAIMPWNYPLWQALRFIAPNLMVGNTVVLKPAELAMGTSKALIEIMKDAFSAALVIEASMTHETCAAVMAHRDLRGVTFTGSTVGGREVAALAGRHLKKLVLELGGSDAYLVLRDADLELAARICAKARMVNSGQSCVAGKRFIVEEDVFEKFLLLFKQEMTQFKFGDPAKAETQIGPLASKRFQKSICEQVEKLKQRGGRVLLGGDCPEGSGAFYPATILVFEKNNPEIESEEIFGPVALVIKAKNAEEALKIANSSNYGLGGAVFSKNEAQARALAQRFESGLVTINEQVKSDPRLPFGGVKSSGYGRELSKFGLYEFCNIKTVGINL